MYQQLLNIFPFLPALWTKRLLSKSDDLSKSFRVDGNEMFKKWEFEKALDFFNLALCYAPPGSVNMALAYGNRSAVYCEISKYLLAIENIKMARENGFPPKKMSQLDAREEKCHQLMEKFGPDLPSAASSFFKLSHPPNKKIPFIVDCLELRQNEKYGRYIITTKDLKTGDIIAIESPAIAWLNPALHRYACFFCTKMNSKSLIPCPHCATVMYCSEECLNRDALSHCNDGFVERYGPLFKDSLRMQLEAFRIAGGVKELLQLMKTSGSQTIFDFDLSNPDDPIYEKNMLTALNALCANVPTHEAIEVKPEQLLNIPPINEKPRTAEERMQLLKFIVCQQSIFISNGTQDPTIRRRGLYLFYSLLNHSCIPNIFGIMCDNKMVSMVIRPVKAGEQMFCTYGALATVHDKKQRQMILHRYQFKCDCDACINDYSLQLPRKDRRFVEPIVVKLEAAEAIKQVKKNSKYIDKNAGKMPSYEVSRLMSQNVLLVACIAGHESIPMKILPGLLDYYMAINQ